jgi:hypothetical protein
VGIMKTNFFKLQKKVLQTTSDVRVLVIIGHVDKYLKIIIFLKQSSLYIPEETCFIKKYKYFMVNNLDVHIHNMRRKLNLHIQQFSAVLLTKRVISMGIGLYNKVPE